MFIDHIVTLRIILEAELYHGNYFYSIPAPPHNWKDIKSEKSLNEDHKKLDKF